MLDAFVGTRLLDYFLPVRILVTGALTLGGCVFTIKMIEVVFGLIGMIFLLPCLLLLTSLHDRILRRESKNLEVFTSCTPPMVFGGLCMLAKALRAVYLGLYREQMLFRMITSLWNCFLMALMFGCVNTVFWHVAQLANMDRILRKAPNLIVSWLREILGTKSHFEVPDLCVRSFIGREDILGKMDEALGADVSYGPHLVVVHGMSGQGKTQVALEYCRRKKASGCAAIFWVDATSESTLRSGFQIIYDCIRNSASALDTTEEKVKFVLQAFADWHTNWVLVFDNLDDILTFPAFQNYIPQNDQGLVIITTRHTGVMDLIKDPEVKTIALHGLESGPALKLLLQQARLINVGADIAHACNIVERLLCHPLAVAQAGSYMSTHQIRLPEFMDHYRRRRDIIIKHTPLLSQYSQRLHNAEREVVLSVFTTWELSFQQLEIQTSVESIETKLLTLFAYFDGKDISEDLFSLDARDRDTTNTGEKSLKWLAHFRKGKHWSGEYYRNVVSMLFRFSLIESYNGAEGGVCCLSLHPLIRDWIRLRTPYKASIEFSLMAVTLIGCFLKPRWDNGQFDISLRTRQHVLAHIIAQEENYDDFLVADIMSVQPPEAVHAFYVVQDLLRSFLGVIGEHSREEKVARRVYLFRRESLGIRDPETLTSMDNLAVVLGSRGKHEEVEELYREELRLCIEVLGKQHPETIASMNNTAELLRHQGKYQEAEDIHRQALQLLETVLGNQHPSTLTSMNNLALVLSKQGKYEESEEMQRQALPLLKTILGYRHSATLTSMNNLAEVLGNQGKYEEAEEMHRQVLELNRAVLGKPHPSTLTSMNNLAQLLSKQGKYQEAEAMHRQALPLWEMVLGKRHPSTLTSMDNLAGLLQLQGKYQEAEKMHRQALQFFKSVLGKQHPSTLSSMNNLALVLRNRGQYQEAEDIHREELQLRQTALGKRHPSTLASMNNLAAVLSSRGKHEEAEEMHRQELQLCMAALGKQHPETLTSMQNLAVILIHRNKYEEAEGIQHQVLQLRKTVLGEQHPSTLASMNSLTAVLSNRGRYQEAEEMQRQVLQLRKAVLGDQHPSTLASMNNLAEILSKQGKYQEAEAMHRQALPLWEMVLGKRHPSTLTSMNNLVEVLSNQGKYTEAEEMHRRA